jgi:hypothetical protein
MQGPTRSVQIETTIIGAEGSKPHFLPDTESGRDPTAAAAAVGIPESEAIPLRSGGSGLPSLLETDPADNPFTTARSMSLAPDRTQRQGMLFLSYIALLFLFINYKPEGSHRRFVRRIVVCIAAAGILVALLGMVQKVLGFTRIYGFWQPQQESSLAIMGPYYYRDFYLHSCIAQQDIEAAL